MDGSRRSPEDIQTEPHHNGCRILVIYAGENMKNKSFRVSVAFYLDRTAIVSARTEAEAIRKMRDRVIKGSRLKVSDHCKEEAQAWEV